MKYWSILVCLGVGCQLLAGCKNADSRIVTTDEYGKIATGNTYEEVMKIIGSPGEKQQMKQNITPPSFIKARIPAHTEAPLKLPEMYVWKNSDGSSVTIYFQDDKVISKSELKLK